MDGVLVPETDQYQKLGSLAGEYGRRSVLDQAKGRRLPDAVLVPATQLFYMAGGPVRECSQWDQRRDHFVVSRFEGGMGAVPYQPGLGQLIKEQVLVAHPPRPGLSNLGFRIDYPRNRVVSCATDKVKLLRSTIVAYDYTTWKTLFVVELAGPEAKALADDLAIDPKGDIYVTDSYNGKIWKVKSDGSEFHVFSDSPSYKMRDPTNQYFGWVRLNGICYHPDGFLLVAHTGCNALFKVSMDARRVRKVDLGLQEGIQLLGDGLVLQNKHTMALSGLDVGVHLLETKDAWESATVTHFCPPPPRLLATAVSLKDGHVFANFVKDPRKPHKHIEGNTFFTTANILTIGEPIFRPVSKEPRRKPHKHIDGNTILTIGEPICRPEPRREPAHTRNLADHYTDIYSGLSFPIDE